MARNKRGPAGRFGARYGASLRKKVQEVEEKRKLLGYVLLNTKLDGENLCYEPRKPFDVLVNYADSHAWGDLWGLNP